MKTIRKKYMFLKKISIICMISILVLNVCHIAVFDLALWNIIIFVLGIGIMSLSLISYAVISRTFCWIEITASEINLMNLRGEILHFSAENILKIVYGLMCYRLYFMGDGKQQVIQCPPGVRVYKNGKGHRGIWIEDFPQAKFEDR